ncbi:amino acid ABC transporter substrate-binding protein [Streptococcus phocae]|uniref:Amino acid ABC transporter substrate-binding protein n=1 Tax=Streptococcus phocae TaxID=119224 RepID=A0A0P6S565_9STRE|nr:amino acid ABC transporter substrate-binding protein [Streptococcus phocae]KPJ23244.1 amino acid ABC transporter substrate-binding protein [Streptococcus phocae]
MKKLQMPILLLLASIFLVACSANNKANQSDQWEQYQKSKTIIVGFDNTFVPMGYKNESGKNTGFDIDLAKAVFKQYDIAVKFQPINWDLKETELNNGKIDLIWNGYSMTKERQEKVSFSKPYMKNEQVIVVKQSSKVKAVSDMAGKVLGAQSGSSGYDAFLKHPKRLKEVVKDKDARQYETFTQAFIDLKSDRIDALLIDRVYANYYLKQEGQLDHYRIIPGAFKGENFAVGMRKSDKILEKKINKAFSTLYQNGTFQTISNKWFGEDVATDFIK